MHRDYWVAIWIYVVVVLLTALPFLGIMGRAVKRRAWIIAAAALWLLAMHWLDCYWLVIPETALRYRGDEVYVDTVVEASGRRIEARPIRMGIVDGARVQVLEGLEAGDELVIR